MKSTPTLQSLALRAREYFGEDGDPFEESVPSSLDVVVAFYSAGASSDEAVGRIATAVRRHVERRGRSAASTDVDEFTQAAIRYLRAVYPDPDMVTDDEERRTLSHLFWGHLVAARHAPEYPPLPSSHLESMRTRRAVKHTIACSCGEELTSKDEETLYSFVRAHAAQQHSTPQRRLTSEPSVESHQIDEDEIVENRGRVEEVRLLQQVGVLPV